MKNPKVIFFLFLAVAATIAFGVHQHRHSVAERERLAYLETLIGSKEHNLELDEGKIHSADDWNHALRLREQSVVDAQRELDEVKARAADQREIALREQALAANQQALAKLQTMNHTFNGQ